MDWKSGFFYRKGWKFYTGEKKRKSTLHLAVQCAFDLLFSAQPCQKSFFLLRSIQRPPDSFDCSDVDSADGRLYFLLYRNQRINLGITHKSHDLRSDFCLYDRNF